MNKTAEEMFLELGYEKREYFDEVQFRKSISLTYTRVIKFDLIRKIYISTNSDLNNIGVRIEEHKAITQQMKELGWLDE